MKVNEWISVEDRLPDISVEILLLEADVGNYVVAFMFEKKNGEHWWEDCNSGVLPDWWKPSHWMHLPEPPEK